MGIAWNSDMEEYPWKTAIRSKKKRLFAVDVGEERKLQGHLGKPSQEIHDDRTE